ncbi:MAG: FtsH protease activity modulator HflK [Holosporaceae bacterium]|jgi:membrane protease subunit HflK|nr:FtsH protease activity modulator HflK [Holosporaceae bacterium]
MSSKNPWENNGNSGKKGSLDGDLLFDFIEKKAKKMWGFGNDGGSKEPLQKFSFPAIAAVVCILYFGSGFYQVQHNQRGVVLRFGEWVRTVGPGLQYILPYPFETVFLQKVTTVNQIDIGSFFKNQQDESLVLTGDSNLANISFSVLWKIKDDGVEDYLFNAKAPEITVRAVAESAMREVVGQTPFTYVQTEGRGDIQNKVRETLQAVMDEYKMGIEIIRVELQRVEPPASVIDSFRDVERAQAEQQSEKNKAEAYDRETRARTRGLIAEKLNNGEAQKRSVVETARGATARFLSAYSQYKLAPDIVSKRLYIETMRDIYGGVNKIIIDSDVKSVPYLPLTELGSMRKNNSKIGGEK